MNTVIILQYAPLVVGACVIAAITVAAVLIVCALLITSD